MFEIGRNMVESYILHWQLLLYWGKTKTNFYSVIISLEKHNLRNINYNANIIIKSLSSKIILNWFF